MNHVMYLTPKPHHVLRTNIYKHIIWFIYGKKNHRCPNFGKGFCIPSWEWSYDLINDLRLTKTIQDTIYMVVTDATCKVLWNCHPPPFLRPICIINRIYTKMLMKLDYIWLTHRCSYWQAYLTIQLKRPTSACIFL